MRINQFLRRVSIGIPIALVVLLLASPTGAQTVCPKDAVYCLYQVTPDYVEANTNLPLSGDDEFLQITTLPFPFTFYGQQFTSAWVSTNGFITFKDINQEPITQPWYNHCTIPTSGAPNGAIYAFWDDLFVDGLASMHTEVLGSAPNRKFVIEWRNVRYIGEQNIFPYFGERLDFEMVLHEAPPGRNGAITLQYRNIAQNPREMGASATIGVENPNGNNAYQFSCNTATIGLPDRPLTVDPVTGTSFFAIQYSPPSAEPTTQTVAVDVKPGSCRNPLNVDGKRKGVLRVAVLGTATLDVTKIDPSSVKLEGVAAQSWSHGDVATPNQCHGHRGDGKMDITFKFDREDVIRALRPVEDGQTMLHLTGNLWPTQSTATLQNGTPIRGEDKVTIIKKAKKKDWHSESRRHNDRDNDRDDDDDDD